MLIAISQHYSLIITGLSNVIMLKVKRMWFNYTMDNAQHSRPINQTLLVSAKCWLNAATLSCTANYLGAALASAITDVEDIERRIRGRRQ
jgi:hypothetical protein